MAGSIEVCDLVVSRGDFSLRVDRLSVAPREVFAILGETGAGKTVLMEAIAGAFPFERGQILLDGKDVESLPIQQRHLGIVYQDYALFPHMTVRENIAYGLRMNGCAPDETRERVARAALARALVLEPEILLLDEPFSALDPTTKDRMYATVRDIHARFDCTIVFITHDFNEAAKLADRVGVVLDGSLHAVMAANELFSGSCDDDVRRFLGRERASC